MISFFTKTATILLFLALNILSQTIVTYQSSDEIIFNPERGFSAYRDLSITPSFVSYLKNNKVSIIQRIYTIPQYNDVPLPESFLNLVKADLNTARNGGVKVVLRFSYTDDQNGADAALDTILLHISQLKPILQENYDVIAYMEAGFIGAWGEWYYSSHNLNNTTSRRAVLYALLDALPEKRDVAVRTPDYKRKIFNYYQPLNFTDAFDGTKRARTGEHNDCFLADETDFGTYLYNNIEGDKNYLNLDNRFVPQGGETCCNCGFAGCVNALANLERMHWSVLNKDYNPDVLALWVNEGCMNEIKRRLGYRFELQQATISDSVKPNGIFNLNFKIINKGFASPYNPRNLEIILRNDSNNNKYKLLTNEDPRFWMSGDTTIVNISAGIPSNMILGKYTAHLFLSDPEPKLHDNPNYAIRLANLNLWEDSTGYNSLNHTVNITNNAGGDDYTGLDYFEPINVVVNVEHHNNSLPEKFDVSVYPNPFNGIINITFNINPQEIESMNIYNVLGKLIKSFSIQDYIDNKIVWNAKDNNSIELNSGVYLFNLKTKNNTVTKKLIYLK